MEHEVMAIAIIRPFDGHEQDVLHLLQEFYAMLARKGYCRDQLFQEGKEPGRFFNFRYWLSDATRREAAEDPDVHRYWHTLSTLGEVETVYEQLREIPLKTVIGNQ